MVEDDALDRACVANIAAHEAVARIIADIGQIAQVASIGQLVIHDDAIVGIFIEQVVDEIGADEASATGDQEVFHDEFSGDKVAR